MVTHAACQEECPRKRKSACRRRADAEVRGKHIVNYLKDDLLILDRLGWSEKRWTEESKLERGRSIIRELCREIDMLMEEQGFTFLEFTPWLERVECGILAARRASNTDVLRRLRAMDCTLTADNADTRSDLHAVFETQRQFCALPPFRSTKYLEPSNTRHTLRYAEVVNYHAFERGLYIGGARALSRLLLPDGAAAPCEEHTVKGLSCVLDGVRNECIAGDIGIEEAYHVRIHLIIRSGCSEFIWEPTEDVKIHYEDRVYYQQEHTWSEDSRRRTDIHGEGFAKMNRRLAEFERLLTGGRDELISEEPFEFLEMTARSENGSAEGVPTFLEHSVSGDISTARQLFALAQPQKAWTRRPKALYLGSLFRTRLAGYRCQRSKEVHWCPGPDLYWERGDRPLRLFRMVHEPVRVSFLKHDAPYGFHVRDILGGAGGVEVIEVVEGSPADVRGVVVGRTVKRLCACDSGQIDDVRYWTKALLEQLLRQLAGQRFIVEFGKGDTEERRHAPVGDAEAAILMEERFMRGFLHELWPEELEKECAGQLFDCEGWRHVFPELHIAGPEHVVAPPICIEEVNHTHTVEASKGGHVIEDEITDANVTAPEKSDDWFSYLFSFLE